MFIYKKYIQSRIIILTFQIILSFKKLFQKMFQKMFRKKLENKSKLEDISGAIFLVTRTAFWRPKNCDKKVN